MEETSPSRVIDGRNLPPAPLDVDGRGGSSNPRVELSDVRRSFGDVIDSACTLDVGRTAVFGRGDHVCLLPASWLASLAGKPD